jgi:hypothetical protein
MAEFDPWPASPPVAIAYKTALPPGFDIVIDTAPDESVWPEPIVVAADGPAAYTVTVEPPIGFLAPTTVAEKEVSARAECAVSKPSSIALIRMAR